MIEKILGGGDIGLSLPEECDCTCNTEKCKNDPDYSEGYKDGKAEMGVAFAL